jgi:lipopolysaccharide biosynthesis glycosyltransferase
MVDSVRQAMPGLPVVQMTDISTPLVPGVDEVIRKDYDGKLMTFRMRHLAGLEEDFITLDTDVIVRRDLRSVFDEPFDVALTMREAPIMSMNGVDLAKEMPYNTGLMFSRNPRFWQEAYAVLMRLEPETHRWWGDQLSVKVAAESERYTVKQLPCDEYNYTPRNRQDMPDAVYMIHYKGERKQWMLKNGLMLRPENTQ